MEWWLGFPAFSYGVGFGTDAVQRFRFAFFFPQPRVADGTQPVAFRPWLEDL